MTWVGGLAVAAGLLAALIAVVSTPAARGATTTSARTSTINPHTVNVKTAPLSYLRKEARAHFMGYSLHRRRATSVNTSAVPSLVAGPRPRQAATRAVYGLDVSSWQGNVNWTAVKDDGAQFAYVKATEGTYYKNPYFTEQYIGSYDQGIIRGAYAFAVPNYSSGTSQADYLASNGGAWSADGRTLPAALDIEYNPYSGGECYGLSQPAMRSWIAAFLNKYKKRTGRWAVIYSTFDWWNTCTGNWSGTHTNDPFWIARYASNPGTLPAGYSSYTFWQFADSGTFPGDQDVFNGSHTRLVALANNT